MAEVKLQKAARLSDLTPRMPLAVTLPDGQKICLVLANGTVYAVADRCPHKEFALSKGDMVTLFTLECPLHGARFDVRTGQVSQGPATDCLATYTVSVVGDEVYVGARRTP